MTIGFWLTAAGLALLAVAVLLIPLWRESKRSGKKALSGPFVAVAIIPVSVGLYFAVTTFDAELADQVVADDFAVIESLAARLASEPDDVDGWILLGRSYIQLGDFARASSAFAEAWSRTAQPDLALKLGYAQAMLFSQENAAFGLAGDIIEDVLTESPTNLSAIFLGALSASLRDDAGLAAERWTQVLASNPPADIAAIASNQLRMLGAGIDPGGTPPAAASGPVIELDVSVADTIDLSRFGPNARVFLIARSSDSPAPIAVEQPPPAISALPGRFSLSNADAMIAGRDLSQYDEVIVTARISASGQPTEQSGDAFTETAVSLPVTQPLSLVIDQIVP